MLKIPYQKIDEIKKFVIYLSNSPEFIHHKWYVKHHLELVEKLSIELCNIYSDADDALVMLLVWLHDFNKISSVNVDDADSYGAGLLRDTGLAEQDVLKVVDLIKMIDAKVDIENAPIEVKIVSSADGASHLLGPFFHLYWYENHYKEIVELMVENQKKISRDWELKIVLPEVRSTFQARYEFMLEQAGKLPSTLLKK